MSFEDIVVDFEEEKEKKQVDDLDEKPLKPNKNALRKIQHVAFILDQSGSMTDSQKQAMTNFNEQLQTLKNETEGIETFVTLTKFDSDVDIKYIDKPLEEIEEMEDYPCNNMTALWDAIGMTALKIKDVMEDEKREGFEHAALIIIITDGYENNSKEFNNPEKLKKIINELEAKGTWTFTFMGADIDPFKAGAHKVFGNLGNIANFNKSDWVGNTATMKRSLTTYYSARKMGVTAVSDYYNDNSTEGSKTDGDKD